MVAKPLCPFCASRACVVEQRLEKLAGYYCQECHKRWFAVEATGTTIPRSSPVPILPQCPHCRRRAQIRVERTIKRETVTETYTCSLCGGELRRDGGKTSA
jgi:transposase-like protein